MGDVTDLRHGPPLNDIPGQLRQLAEMIEGREVEAAAVLLIIPRDNDWPEIFGWGEHLSDYGNIAVCELAKTWFVNNNVVRS